MESSNTLFQVSPARWATILSAFLVFLVIATGKVRYTYGDSRYCLLTSAAILESGSPKLDRYARELDLPAENGNLYWMLFFDPVSQHTYYDYPVGTPLFSVPFVWIGKKLGMNPVLRPDDAAIQIAIAAVLSVLIFLVLHRLARLFLDEWSALLFALAFFFGTSLTSTLGTALWSQNFQSLFILLAVLELAWVHQGRRQRLRGGWLGVLLFAAWLCRPTTTAFILLVFAFAVWKHRKSIPWLFGVSGGLFMLFLIWSKFEYGDWLPRYYDPSNWEPKFSLLENLVPVWFGPARGLWSFTPALLLAFAGWALPRARIEPLFWMGWIWLLLHTWMILRSPSPWGGWCYGPRFFTELLPMFALILLLVAKEAAAWGPKLGNRLAVAFLVLSGLGVYIHTVQGLYNWETNSWNDAPGIDATWKQRRSDWRYPQFLASASQMKVKKRDADALQRVNNLIFRLPPESALLFGQPDPVLREFFLYWNHHKMVCNGGKVYNSLAALEEAGITEFWCMAENVVVLQDRGGYNIDSMGNRLQLGEFLKFAEEYTAILSGKDDASHQLSDETRRYLRIAGSGIDSLKLRDSYIAILDKGRLVHEEMGPKLLTHTLHGKPEIKITSGGLFFGNVSSIFLRGTEWSPNDRGMNVVVLNENREVVWATVFDTHAEDRERGVLYRVKASNR